MAGGSKPRKGSKGGGGATGEQSNKELLDGILKEFGVSNKKELLENGSFQLYAADHNIDLKNREHLLKVYRKFVGLPTHERNATGPTAINGVDVTRNFLPWKVFNLNPQTATARDIKKAYNNLAKTHHPDHGGRRDVFEALTTMKDSLLALY